MQLQDVWNAVEYVRNDDEEIIAAQIPIELWRFLLDRVQEMEDKAAARQRLAKLRNTQESRRVDADQ
ncbi:MAG: hypothetical protein JXQ72_08870 [Anaerolineae bacterium]|nr:hypothetical protein [Anaerolineae bacterium]